MTERAKSRRERRQARRNVLTDEVDNSIRIKNSLTVKDVKPLTDTQRNVVEQYYQGQNLFLTGLPGTGKSYLACALAIKDILTNNCEQDKVVIVRSSVPSKSIGFLPGNAKEKMKQYEAPYEGIFSEIFGRGDAYSILKSKQLLEFESSSFMRGLTYNNTIMIVDEAQNLEWNELFCIVTRLGQNSRIIFCGDYKQSDLKDSVYSSVSKKDDYLKFLSVIKNIKSFSVVDFMIDDIVRSSIVKEFIIEANKLALI